MLHCEYCKTEYHRAPSNIAESKYCSKQCKDKAPRQGKVIVNTVCSVCSLGFHVKPSQQSKRFTCSRVCQGKYRTKESLKREHKPAQYRKTYAYWQWMLAVKNRDRWTCVNCSSKTKVIAHHIFRFWSFPEFRYSIDNGMTLCRICHKTVSKHDRHWELQRL